MKDDIVIVGAARTPVGAFNGAFGSLPAHELGKAAIVEAHEARQGRGQGGGPRSSSGQILTAGRGPEPGPAGFDRAPASRSRARPGA